MLNIGDGNGNGNGDGVIVLVNIIQPRMMRGREWFIVHHQFVHLGHGCFSGGRDVKSPSSSSARPRSRLETQYAIVIVKCVLNAIGIHDGSTRHRSDRM